MDRFSAAEMSEFDAQSTFTKQINSAKIQINGMLRRVNKLNRAQLDQLCAELAAEGTTYAEKRILRAIIIELEAR